MLACELWFSPTSGAVNGGVVEEGVPDIQPCHDKRAND
jgi:hypothetical protein